MSALVGLKQVSRPKYEMLADVRLGSIRVDFAVSGPCPVRAQGRNYRAALRALLDHGYGPDWIRASVRQCGAMATHGTAPVSDDWRHGRTKGNLFPHLRPCSNLQVNYRARFGSSETVTGPKARNLF